jgi:hypothetical protein
LLLSCPRTSLSLSSLLLSLSLDSSARPAAAGAVAAAAFGWGGGVCFAACLPALADEEFLFFEEWCEPEPFDAPAEPPADAAPEVDDAPWDSFALPCPFLLTFPALPTTSCRGEGFWFCDTEWLNSSHIDESTAASSEKKFTSLSAASAVPDLPPALLPLAAALDLLEFWPWLPLAVPAVWT